MALAACARAAAPTTTYALEPTMAINLSGEAFTDSRLIQTASIAPTVAASFAVALAAGARAATTATTYALEPPAFLLRLRQQIILPLLQTAMPTASATAALAMALAAGP